LRLSTKGNATSYPIAVVNGTLPDEK